MAKIEAKNPDDKFCESCGKPFGCGARRDGCWCADVRVPAEIADALKAKYKDCLCPDCLQRLSSTDAFIVSYPDGTSEIVAGAVRVDTQNYHEGMFDFYDDRGNLLKQISMSANINWEIVRLNEAVRPKK